MENNIAHIEMGYPLCRFCKHSKWVDNRLICDCAVDLVTADLVSADAARKYMCGVNGRYFERRNK